MCREGEKVRVITVEPHYNSTIGNQNFVRNIEVSLTQGVSGAFPVGMV